MLLMLESEKSTEREGGCTGWEIETPALELMCSADTGCAEVLSLSLNYSFPPKEWVT